MSNAISPVTQNQAVDQTAAVRRPKTPEAKPQHPPVDTVSISSTAMSVAKAAVAEATETPAQTAQEARAGDNQAKRLLAKEAYGRK